MARRYSRSDDHATFMIIVLAAGFYWTHQTLVATIGRIATAVAIVVLLLLVFTKVLKVVRWIRSRRRPSLLGLTVIDEMSGLEFERYVASLLKHNGYQNVRLTEKYDYGIDIIAERDGITWGIQVKRCSGLVKANAVRQVVTALRMYGCDRAMVITNGYFSRVAGELAESNQCELIDRSIFNDWFN